MELSKKETNIIKGLAALFLVFLHLFNTREYTGNIQSILLIKGVPVEYYISLVTGSCVSMYLFCSGYGLSMISKNKDICIKDNLTRILKLLINYWITLIVFVVIGHLLGNENYPGSLKEFLMNFFLISKSYNGAWWFLQTYVILVLTSKSIINLVKKNNSIAIFITSGVLYFVAFLQSVKGIFIIGDNEFMQILSNMLFNFLNCQFSFIVGILFVKESIISRIRLILDKKKYAQLLPILLTLIILAMNIIIENWVIGPITAILVIITISITKINKSIQNFLIYISSHSTNIWLTHMFFYMVFFKKLVYAPKLSILIFSWLILLCIGTSYLINYIYKFALNAFNYSIYSLDIYSQNKSV